METLTLLHFLWEHKGKVFRFQNHNGDWIDAIAEPDELMINVGDMLSRHTNNKLKSTIHRVVNPPRELWEYFQIFYSFLYAPGERNATKCIRKND